MRQLRIDRSITPKNEAALVRYYNEVDRLPLITAEEEVVLARRIRLGDRAALHKLVNANLRFVISVAKKYQHMGLAFSDLIAEGNLGLIKAAGHFDETKGFRFISYAVWWIRQAMSCALAEHMRTIRLPANMGRAITQLRSTYERLEKVLERCPTDGELSESLPVFDPKEPVYVNAFIRSTASLDAPFLSGEDQTMLDFLADDNSLKPDAQIVEKERSILVRRCLNILPPLEQYFLESSYGLDALGRERTISELAEELDMNKETLRQLRKRSIAKIQSAIERGRIPL